MPITTTYYSTDTPVTIPAGSPGEGGSTLNIPDSYIISDITVDVDIAGDSVIVDLFAPGGFPSVTLIYFDPGVVTNFDNITNPVFGFMDDFIGYSTLGNWGLHVYTFNPFVDSYINSWDINITYEPPPPSSGTEFFPSAPNAITVPTNIRYGIGSGIRKNHKFKFEIVNNASLTLNSNKRVGINSTVEGIIISANSTGSGSNTVLTLNKYRNGIVTSLVSQAIQLNSGATYQYKQFADYITKTVDSGDVLFFTVDSIGTSVTNLNVQLILKSRD